MYKGFLIGLALVFYPASYLLAKDKFVDKFAMVEELLPAARNGDVDAQIALAKVLAQFAIPEYDIAAFHWLKKAEESHTNEAYYYLADFYYEGIGTEVNYQKALLLYNFLAEEEYPLAQYKLGKMYYYGQGIEPDMLEAVKWVVRAAKQEVVEAKDLIKELLKEAQGEEAQELIEYAAENDDAMGLYLKGVSHLYGKNGFTQDIEEGMEFLRKAAERQNILAQCELGKIYEKGLFGFENERKAYDYYLKAAQNGNEDAQLRVAQMHYFGIEGEKDYVQSYAWAEVALGKGKKEAAVLKQEAAHHLDSEELEQAQYWSSNYIKAAEPEGEDNI